MLTVILDRTRKKMPLATVKNLPGPDADLTPAQMRTLAAALMAAASECEARPTDDRHFLRCERRY